MAESTAQKLRASFQGLKGLQRSLTTTNSTSSTMPTQADFKTKLRFEPSKLSTGILKKYLLDLLNETEAETLLSCEPPSQYTKDPNNFTDYRVLKEMGLMAIRDWKNRLTKDKGDVECLYLTDDMVAMDARCFYESWKVIQEEVGNHEKQMSFFRLVSEIVADLSNRNYVDISLEGDQCTLPMNSMEVPKETTTAPIPTPPPSPTNILQQPILQPVPCKKETPALSTPKDSLNEIVMNDCFPDSDDENEASGDGVIEEVLETELGIDW